MVVDGAIHKDLEIFLEKIELKHEFFRLVKIKRNIGLGAVLRYGVRASSCPMIARIDSDDIVHTERFEKQMSFLIENNDVSILGSYVGEFEDTINRLRINNLPLTFEDVKKYTKLRNPLAHSSVMMRRHDVLKAGNYRRFRKSQDYELFSRMVYLGFRIENLPEVLTYIRVGIDRDKRRQSWASARGNLKVLKLMYQRKQVNIFEYFFIKNIRIILPLIPSKIFSKFHSVFFRNRL